MTPPDGREGFLKFEELARVASDQEFKIVHRPESQPIRLPSMSHRPESNTIALWLERPATGMANVHGLESCKTRLWLDSTLARVARGQDVKRYHCHILYCHILLSLHNFQYLANILKIMTTKRFRG